MSLSRSVSPYAVDELPMRWTSRDFYSQFHQIEVIIFASFTESDMYAWLAMASDFGRGRRDMTWFKLKYDFYIECKMRIRNLQRKIDDLAVCRELLLTGKEQTFRCIGTFIYGAKVYQPSIQSTDVSFLRTLLWHASSASCTSIIVSVECFWHAANTLWLLQSSNSSLIICVGILCLAEN